MVRNTASQLRDSPFYVAQAAFSNQIGAALREELGASRRATKTLMRWTGVSDVTARAWLYGRASPSGPHLVSLAANSKAVLTAFLRLAGYGDLELGLKLRDIETGLLRVIEQIRAITGSSD